MTEFQLLWELPHWQLGLVAFLIVLAGSLQGSTGFGFNLLAAPTIAAVAPAFIPGPMLILSLVVSLGGVLGERRFVNISGLSSALLGRTIASSLAVVFLSGIQQKVFLAIFGVLVLMAVGLSLSKLRIEPTRFVIFWAGMFSGFMGTLTSIGAPPMALAMQSVSGPHMRSTLNAFFVVGTLISIAMLAISGHLSLQDLALAVAMVPFALVGLYSSKWTRSYLDKGWMRTAVLSISGLSGILMIVKAALA